MAPALPSTLAMIETLIACPSVSCTQPAFDQDNRAVIDHLAEWASNLGFVVEVQALANGKANLVARLGGCEDQPGGLVLSGHTDTVPCDPALWSSDPFVATEREGRLYGLGSADMKSFFAIALAAARGFEAKRLSRPLVLLATADEESSMAGARAVLAANRRLGRRAVIGEPTGLAPIRMHKGVLLEAISVTGRAGHSSDPSLGANAIEGMHRVLGEVLAFREELRNRYRNPAFAVAYPTLNLGSIHGGDNPNRICGHCEVQMDIRPLPGMDLDTLHESLLTRLRPVLADREDLRLEVRRLFAGLPPFETPATAELVQVAEAYTGHAAGAVAFGTEAPFLSQLGMETIVLGPGFIAQAHQPDEYLPLDHIPKGIELLGRLIQRFCVDEA